MNIEKVSSSTQVNAAVASESGVPAKKSQATPAVMAGEASKGASKTLGNVGPARGALSLTNPRAQKAVQKSLEQLAAKGMEPKEFKARSVEIDGLGMTHVRLDRFQDGVRVFGEQVITHFAAGNDTNVASLTADVAPLPFGLASTGKMTDEQALAIAQGAFASELHRPAEMERVLFQLDDGSYTAGFWVKLVNLDVPNPRAMNYLIDSETKSIVRAWNQIDGFAGPNAKALAARNIAAAALKARKDEPKTEGAADDQTIYSGPVDLQTKKTGALYTLNDEGRKVSTKDARNQQRAYSAVDVTDENDVWMEKTDSERHVAATDAHYVGEMFHDFMLETVGRDSIDGKGMVATTNVHIGTRYNNAFWDGRSMNNGDGDGKTFSPLADPSVNAHEPMHGVTEYAGGLNYYGESGGMNEALSDVASAAFLAWLAEKNPNIKPTSIYYIGEFCFTPKVPGDALRYMNNPTKDGYSVDHYSKYPQQTEVHGSSGIGNNAFYQLTAPNEGKEPNSVSKVAVQDGISVLDGWKIFYRALTNYSTPSSNFAAFRKGCIQAATDLFGADSQAVQKVKEAWSAVGVN